MSKSIQFQYNGENLFPIVVEKVTNSNGTAIKYSDGTMICTKKISITIPSTTAWGTLYDGSASGGNFATPFIETPIVSVTPVYSAFVEKVVANTSGISTITLARPTNTTNWNVPLDIIAIGKWK